MKKIILLIGVLLTMSACTIVSDTERGARYNFGKLSGDVLEPGTHFWFPYFMGSRTLNVSIQSIQNTSSSGTKDQQEVTTTTVVNLRINPEQVVSVFRDIGSEESLLMRINPLIQESVNSVISRYTAEELLTKRNDVKLQIEELAKSQISKYGVEVRDVSLKDMQYSNEYSASIEKKQIADQRAKQAEYEAQERINEAHGRKEVAKKDAEALLIKSRAEADSNQMKQATLTEQLIRYQMIQKWNGQLPQVSGSGSGMMFNMSLGKESK